MNASPRRAYIALGVVLAAFATVALAATFPYFSPVTGILKGNANTYVTTAAASSDVIALWTGTCNGSSVLKGDGSCAAVSSGGTVSSVALTAPSGLTVTGSPVTTSGTLAITTTLSGVVHGNGTGFTAGNVALGSEVSGTLPVGSGGTGAATLSGVLKGNGTSAFTSAVASDVYGLWAGGCSSSNYLRGDGTCASPAGVGTVTSVGLTMPSGFSVGGSPVTSSGTLAVTTTLNGNLRGNGSGITTGAVALGSEVSGTLPVANGGTGVGTSTGTGSVVLSASPTFSGTITGGTFSGTFSGNGASISSLNGSNISTGTVGVPVSTTTGVFSTSLTVAGQSVCQADGTNCPGGSGVKIAAADVTVSGAACTVSRSVANTPSCTYNSTGNYTVTFTSGFFSGNTPICVADAWNGGTGRSATVGGINSNAVNVGLRDLASNPQDGGFALTCFGT